MFCLNVYLEFFGVVKSKAVLTEYFNKVIHL